jgi:1,4-dihydroxy-2-naphthoyl-CoA hydrolase
MDNIWNKDIDIVHTELFVKDCILERLGIKFLERGDDYLKASMPVDKRTIQPLGILHGGASAVLAETLGSAASYMSLDPSRYSVGLEINANHIKSISSGIVIGIAKPVHLGNSTQVWDITIKNEKDQLICISRLTMAVLTKKS